MKRRTAASFVLCLCCAVSVADAQHADDREVRFEPPSVDRVYPPPPLTPPKDGDGPPPAPIAEDGAAANEAGPEPASAPEPEPPPAAATEPATDTSGATEAVPLPHEVQPAPEPEQAAPSYGASGRAKQTEPGTKRISLEDARDLPGAFGDPLRIIEMMPGVVPVSNGLPYAYVRGAPPASQGYLYDDMLLPQIFHLGVGPQVIHPRMNGPVDFYPSVAPPYHGRRTGALVESKAIPHSYRLQGEVELRLLDVNAFVEAPVLGGNVQAAVRYGYPGLVLKAFSPETTATYWDGQVRYELPLNADNRMQLIWIGSFDDLDQPPFGTGATETKAVRLHFHRTELRLIHDTADNGELGTALRFGYDDSALGTAVAVRAFTFGPRIWFRRPFGAGHRLHAGADMLSSTGEVVDGGGTLSGIDGQVQVGLPQIAEASARNQGGIFGETVLRTSDATRLRAGARLDFWMVQGNLNIGVDPRLRFIWDAVPSTELYVAAGLAHQPTVFLLPLPGLSDVALSKDLTRAYQLETGARQQLPHNIEVEVSPYFTYQDGVLLPELVRDGIVAEDPPVVDVYSYGVEWFTRGDVDQRLKFVGSYTLGWSRAKSPANLLGDFRPDSDVRHVLNLTTRYDFTWGLNLGLRVGTRSGRLVEQQNARYAQRLPWFTRIDARVGYDWRGRWGPMTAYVEWLNVAARPEYLDADCFFGQCRAEAAPAISVPNFGVRGTFGPAKTNSPNMGFSEPPVSASARMP